MSTSDYYQVKITDCQSLLENNWQDKNLGNKIGKYMCYVWGEWKLKSPSFQLPIFKELLGCFASETRDDEILWLASKRCKHRVGNHSSRSRQLSPNTPTRQADIKAEGWSMREIPARLGRPMQLRSITWPRKMFTFLTCTHIANIH